MQYPPEKRFQNALVSLFLLSEALYLPARPQDNWLLLLIAGVLSALLFMLLHRLCGTVSLLAGTGFWSAAFGCIAALFALWSAYTSLMRLSLFFSKTAFPNLPRIVVALLVFVTTLYLAKNGRTTLAIWSFPILITVLLPFLLSMALTMPYWQPTQVLPLTTRSAAAFASATANCILQVYLPLLFPFVLFSGKQSHSFASGIFVSGGLLSLAAARNLMLLGLYTVTQVAYPTYAAAGLVAVGDFFQRAESLIAGCLTLCVLARIAVLLLVAAYGLRPMYAKLHTKKTSPKVPSRL